MVIYLIAWGICEFLGGLTGQMPSRWALLLATAAAHLTVLAAGPRASVDYTNHFAVVVQGGRPRAERAAAEHDCSVIDSIGDLTNHYLLQCHSVKERSTEHSEHHVNRLRGSDGIMWAEQQYYKKRKKRDGAGYFPLVSEVSGPFVFGSSSRIVHGQPASLRPAQNFWPDPLFSEQWYLNGGAHDGSDMNVIPAWQKGYSGKGVVVSILDDGIQPNHPDLAVNYDSQASLDINDNDDDPTPRDDGSNRHGTRCAGEVAALAGNSVCGVGVAPNASIGGVRMLDGGVNDYVEAKALSYRRSHIDVYSASWGPEDDGMTVDGPGPLARRAFIEGVLKGRGGKGSIFVWASGNGGQYMDNCNCDGYTNSIFTLSISSASQGGKKPWYLEECASTLATTFSSGTAVRDKSIITCDQDAALRPKHICTKSHTGTSASAPLAAGLCALALEANPMLTWRDMQYIVLMTSRYRPLASEGGWFTNAIGRKVNHKFGYGMMDGAAMVDLAGRWTSVPAQHICISPIDSRTRSIPTGDGAQLRVSMQVTGCQSPSQTVNYLEHVQCKVTLTYVPRGNLRIVLTSPSGTGTTLLFGRPRDETGSSFDRWPFMTVHFWGEQPHGVWNLTIIPVDPRSTKTDGVLKEWQLILYGTEQQPVRARTAAQAQFGSSSTVRSPLVGRSQTSVAPDVLCSLQCVRSCQTKPVGPGCDRCRELHKSDCSRSCEPGTFASLGAGCKACHSSCVACFGDRQNQCLKCPRHHYLISELSVCVVVCPDGYFIVNEMCMSCGAHCESCTGSASHCLSCSAHLILYNNQCVASCPAGTYERNHRCEPCAVTCQTCVGPSDANCVLCRHGLMHAAGQCVAACPEGSYGDVSRGDCVSCLPGCAVCSSLGSCDACYDQLQLSADTGVCESADQHRCADGEFYEGGSCQRCHRSCLSCSGPSSVDCTQCQSDTFLHNGLCRGDCPEGLSSVGGLCTACPHACLDCYTVQRCSSCQPGLLLHNDTCVAACPDRTYRSLEECVPCAPACSTCFGGKPNECASCPSGGLLVSGSCYATCPVGYYQSWSDCRRCHRTCDTCTGSALTNCRSCRDGYQLLAEYSTCMPCGSHEFFAREARLCRPCHSTCGTCEGAGSSSCTSCAGELRLEVPSHRCVPCCGQLRNASGGALRPTHCCQCHPTNGRCARGTRRRTADGYYMQQEVSSGAPSWLYAQAVALCASLVVCFTLIFAALQCRQRTRRHYHPVLELNDGEEHLALTDYQDKDHMDDWSDDDHLVVYDART